MSPRPWRFGVAGSARTVGRWKELARRVESLGYATILVPDHLAIVSELGPLASLTIAAEATDTIKLGSLVLSNELRHPAVLAKELATIDLVSSGRLEIGLGAGWLARDFSEIGIPFDPPGTRIARLAEAVTVIKGLMSDGPVDFAGEFYEIRGLEGVPKPAQRPHPPFLIAGGGRKLLELAAREADIISVNVSMPGGVLEGSVAATATSAETLRKIDWIRTCVGSRFESIELSTFAIAVVVTDDRGSVADALSAQTGMTREEVLASPQCYLGSVAQLADHLTGLRETYGISYITIPIEAAEDFAPVMHQLLA